MPWKPWVLAAAVCLSLATVVDGGVTIVKTKDGDGVNFPQVGKSIKVCVGVCACVRM